MIPIGKILAHEQSNMISRIGAILGVAAVFSFVVSPLRAADETIRAAELRCEYLVDPLGIDVVEPRLSWQIRSSDPASTRPASIGLPCFGRRQRSKPSRPIAATSGTRAE